MQPIRMTRAEYEATIGQLPDSKLDTTPAPVRMTRAEYEQQFGALPGTTMSVAQRNRLAGIRTEPQTRGQEFQADLNLQGQRQADILSQDQERMNRIFERVRLGEISPAKGTFQSIGSRAFTGGQMFAEGARGLAKMILPEAAEREIAEFNQFMREGFLQRNTSFYQKLEQEDPESAKLIADIGDSYQNDETFRADVIAAGGIAGVLSNLVGAGAARSITPDVTDLPRPDLNTVRQTVVDAGRNLSVLSDERVVNGIANDIYTIERKYSPTRKALERSKDEGRSSRIRIAQSNVLDGAVDEDGVITTLGDNGAYQRYKQQTIGDSENLVRRSLDQEGATVSLSDLQNYAKNAILQSNLSGSDLTKALNGIENEIKGMAIRSDVDGNVPLSTIHDAKVSMYEHIDYNSDPETRIYRTTLANAYKRFVEDNSSVNIAEINAELAKYYDDLARLKALDGKRVQGGRLGRYASQIVGTAAGTAIGSFGGPVGGAVGALIGADLGSRLRSFQMQRVFKGRDRDFSPNAVLDSAKLRIADSPIDGSMLAGIEITPEIENVLFQINQNVLLQERAIKAGDLVKVKALKEIYATLVRKLDNEIYESDSLNIDQNIDTSAASRNASPTGIQDNNTPTVTAVNTMIVENPDDLFRPKSFMQRVKEALKDQRGALMPDRNIGDNQIESRVDYTKLSERGLDNVNKFLAHVDKTAELDLVDYDTVRRNIDVIAERLGIDPSQPDKKLADLLAEEYQGQISGRILPADADTQGATPSTNLLEEAKGKTLEEFIENQGKTVHHATDSQVFDPADFDVTKAAKGEQYFNPLGQGMYVSTNPDFVKRFGKNRMELVLPANAKIKTITQDEWLGGYGMDLVNEAFEEMGGIPSSISQTELNRVVRNAPIDALNQVDSLISQKEGLDVADKFVEALNKVQTKRNSKFDAIVYEATDYAFDADEIVIPDPSILKTRTQLEDIWKQANQ